MIAYENGSEFKETGHVCPAVRGGSELHVIDRGRVMQNTLIESFIRKFLEECLTNICIEIPMTC